MRHSPILRIEAAVSGSDERLRFSKLVRGADQEMPSTGEVEEMFRHVSLTSAHIYGFAATYSYPEDSRPDPKTVPRNTLVEVALPYCLHIPDGLMVTITVPGFSEEAVAIFEKTWTHQAHGSSDVDLFLEDRLAYLEPFELTMPTLPDIPLLGPEPACKGKNIERARETNGYFRYSRLRIFFDTFREVVDPASGDIFEAAKREAVERALEIVNRVIDVYRFVTKEDHVQRLGSVHVSDLYFAKHNCGIHGASLAYGGIQKAVMNRPGSELTEISTLLETGADLPLPELLFLDAEAALYEHRTVLTVVHAFQALELFLEDFLESRFALSGLKEDAILEKFRACLRTKDRLQDLLFEATSHRLSENSGLWSTFCKLYGNTRNPLLHSAKQINKEDAEACLQVCRGIVAWISRLQVL